MRKLKVFESVSANGFVAGPDGDLSWAYEQSTSPEFQKWVAANASGPSALLFGRITYEMMASYWPTPQATTQQPDVARGMNAATKFVASRTLNRPTWSNTTLLTGDLPEAVRTLKQQPGVDLVVLGSASIVTQLLDAKLVDSVQLVIKPVALGTGTPIFSGIHTRTPLKLTNSRAFPDGNVVLDYDVT